nr:hypothetical protein [uncultured Psychroserpens sp.]
MKIVKYILGSLLILSALGGFLQGEMLASLFLFILGLILLPPISMKIKIELKLYRNKAIRYTTYAVLFVFAGSFINTNSIISKQDNLVDRDNYIDQNSKKVEVENSTKKTQPIRNIILWNSDFNKSEILGSWMLEQYFYETDKSNVTNTEDGNSEQKKLTLTNSKYQTSYPFGIGDNSPLNYTLTKNYLSVKTENLKTEIYGYRLHLSDDKKMLLLKEKSGLNQIFHKVE